MPHLIVTRVSDDGNRIQLIGVCEFTKRKEFDEKLRALVEAMGWDMSEFEYTHCYSNNIIDRFPG